MSMLNLKPAVVRVVYSAALVLGFFLLPWWWTVGWAVVGWLLYAVYWEAVFIGIAYDSIFLVGSFPWLTALMIGVGLASTGFRLLTSYYGSI